MSDNAPFYNNKGQGRMYVCMYLYPYQTWFRVKTKKLYKKIQKRKIYTKTKEEV